MGKRRFGKSILVACVTGLMFSCEPAEQKEEIVEVEELTLLVGTYTGRDSEGVYMYKFNPETAEVRLVDVAEGLINPSFLALSPDNMYVYAVGEMEGGSVKALSLGDSTITLLNEVSSAGVHPCHLDVDESGKWVIVGNYSSGSLAVLPIKDGGILGEAVQELKHKGSGPNKERQASPHVHSVNIAPNNKDVFVPDLGMDKVIAYRFNDSTGKLTEGKSMAVSPGSGPRHFTFHPNGKFGYVVQEMTGTLTVFNYTDGNLETVEEVSTLPDGFDGKNASSDLHISPDGKFLYAANRYHDSIVVFSINAATGKLTQVSHHSTLGEIPRNFAISPDGKYVLVGNQESDNIIIFKRDIATGKLTPTGQEIAVSMPVCLLFVE
ncbi:MAG: 6-phosphogluconolactonase [Arcticibacterium sp.]|jgi:6-phosphogluconolactonase